MMALRTLYLALVALAPVGGTAEPSPAPTPDPPAARAASPRPDNIRTVTLDPNERRPVCTRHVPTGTRIAGQRCESPPREPTAADRVGREIMRRDVEAMRDQQMLRDQARQTAMAEALRRRGNQ